MRTAALIDPYAGTCNTLNADSWWAQQPAYWQPAIVRLTVQAAAADVQQLHGAGRAEHVDAPRAGLDVLRDAVPARLPAERVDPDARAAARRLDASSAARSPTRKQNYVASYWYYTLHLPFGSPIGTWRFQADLDGVTRETTFVVQAAVPPKIDGGRVLQRRRSATTS